MSLLPVSLSNEGVLHRGTPHLQQVPDVLREIFLSLPIADLERMHLGCHQWLYVMNNIAKEAVRKQWPHLFAEYDHPRRNWIPIYCIKMRATENIARGCFQLTRLQFDDYTLGYGMDLGKLVVKDREGDMGILSLEGGGIYKGWQKGQYYQACLGRVFCDCTRNMQLWNMQTGKNLAHLKDTRVFNFSLYDNITLVLNHDCQPPLTFLYDAERQLLRQFLPPPGFNYLSVSKSKLQKGRETSFPSREISFMWTATEEDTVKDQIIAVYHMDKEEKDLLPQSTYRLSLSFNLSDPIRLVHLHEGYTLVWIEPEFKSVTLGWVIFDKNNKRVDFLDGILGVVWMPGKIILATFTSIGTQNMCVLDTKTGLIGKPAHAPFLRQEKDLSWLHAIDERHVAYLGRGVNCIALFVCDVTTMRYCGYKVPQIAEGDFEQYIPVFFDGEKLVWTSTLKETVDLCVMDFSVRNPSDPRVQKIGKAVNYKTALRPWAGHPYRWEPRAITWSRGFYKYWWITAAIVVLGFIHFSRQESRKERS